jgi:O-antigen/teichoic acid export membrane protein
MLLSQTAINFAANLFSAAFGLINVIVFTRFLAPNEFGTYVLGLGFAQITSTFMVSWLRLPIMREQARGDGTDVRGIIVPGLVLSCLLAPIAYLGAPLVGLTALPASAAAGLALAIGFFETSLELLRAKLRAFTVMKATMVRAVLVSAFGIAFIAVGHTGTLLLTATALAYFLATLAITRTAWGATAIRFDGTRLLRMVRAGLPLTASLTLLAFSSVIDRFIIAHLAGSASAGQYTAGVDLVRQALMIPAISAAAAFFPLAVQIHANKGVAAARGHLEECFEFLLTGMLPACLGFAVLSAHLANVILGPDFRSTAVAVMPIVSIAVIFQMLSYQYLHVSFLLSERNSFYLWNTGSVLIFNAVVSYFLIQHYGSAGAAWGRLAAEIFGFFGALLLTRWAFHMPMPLGRLTRVLIAAVAMAIVVRGLDLAIAPSDKIGLAILIPIGIVIYMVMCWLLDIAQTRYRLQRGLEIASNALTQLRLGGLRP